MSELKVPLFRLVHASDIVPRAMEVGSLSIILAFVPLWLMEKVAKDQSRKDFLLKKRQLLTSFVLSLNKYVHAGKFYYLNTDIFSEKDPVTSLKLMLRISGKGWKNLLLDHLMPCYVDGLSLQVGNLQKKTNADSTASAIS